MALVPHPRYDSRDQNYNVGLIMITKDFNETRRSRPAKLVEANVDLPVGSFVTATGWGSETIPGAPMSENLRAISLHVIDNQECLEKNQELIDVTDK
ncbi:granzyme F-like [Ctenocephalides felis]|uniref:granzyme F-like n=1 Tax=Ctenocephalides felis TaxID=7515 RepID=UPI000E6E3123|nr:granzyme F-like [Ctenocephalides felis]